jgi:maleylpyruvate isomerase
MTVPVDRLALMRDGEAFVLGLIAAQSDDDLRGPSALPGWTRAHIVSHLARNADALCNLLDWARTGVVTPMYPSAEARVDGIEAGVARPIGEQRADLENASAHFVAECDAMTEAAWDAEVRTRANRAVRGVEIPWMRIRESWVHGVDLGVGASFADVPRGVVDPLIDEVARGLAGRDDCPPMTIVQRDGTRTWRIGPLDASGDAITTVEHDGPVLLAWLLGRDAPDLAAAPHPPNWL